MSVHPTLRQAGAKLRTIRNVLKRHERIRFLLARGRWHEGQSAFGLPKLKQERIKVRKAPPKEAPAEQAAAAESTPAQPAKGQPPKGS